MNGSQVPESGILPEVNVVCGVIVSGDGGRYLACRRPEGKHLGGLWEFPGGKVDPGESPEAALKRELMEELGVVVEIKERLTPVRWHYETVTVMLMPFYCKIASGMLRAIEHSEMIWISCGEFSKLEWAPADQPILQELVILSEFAAEKE